ncbi:MAG: hypothetical protein ACYTF7_11610 [Planctomycetota bacterium]|jgi:hypothetical protein
MRIELAEKEVRSQSFAFERAIALLLGAIVFLVLVNLIGWHIANSIPMAPLLMFLLFFFVGSGIFFGVPILLYVILRRRSVRAKFTTAPRTEYTQFKRSDWWKPVMLLPSGLPVVIRYVLGLELWDATTTGFPQYFYCPKQYVQDIERATSVSIIRTSGWLHLLAAIEFPDQEQPGATTRDEVAQ